MVLVMVLVMVMVMVMVHGTMFNKLDVESRLAGTPHRVICINVKHLINLTINFQFFFPAILRYIYQNPKSGKNLANIRYKHYIRYKSVINNAIITKI